MTEKVKTPKKEINPLLQDYHPNSHYDVSTLRTILDRTANQLTQGVTKGVCPPKLFETLKQLETDAKELENVLYAEHLERVRQREEQQAAAEKAAKKAYYDSYLNRMDNKDKEKALDLIEKLNRLRNGSPIYDEYEIQLRLLFKFYDAIKD